MDNTPRLSIGMAHFADFDGVYFTIQSLRLYQDRGLMKSTELIVVDNSVGHPESDALFKATDKAVGGFLPSAGQGGPQECGVANIRYVPFHERQSTSATRQAIIDNAAAPIVLVLDCHVMLDPGALLRLVEHIEAADETPTIWNGPLRHDNLAADQVETHFNRTWGGGMFGQWGRAWRCCDGGVLFSVTNDDGRVSFIDLVEQSPLSTCHRCGREFPSLEWSGYDRALKAAGFRQLAVDPNDEPFEVPGCGLGAFAIRRADWPGFHPHHRGFGGEELYIHDRYRQLGGRAVCLPFFGWSHRFPRPRGVPYALRLWDKVRNYVLHWNDLGRDLDDVHRHFVLEGDLRQHQWDQLIADPVGMIDPPSGNTTASCNTCNDFEQVATLDEMFAALASTRRDLDQHMPKLRELAEQCNAVAEFSKRRESTVALASSRPAIFRSWQAERHSIINRAVKWLNDEGCSASFSNVNSDQVSAEEFAAAGPFDLLFIDTVHTFARLSHELQTFGPHVSRYIVMHDTELHGNKGSDGGPGLLAAIRQFVQANPKWSVVYHTRHQYGLTVISRDQRDKPKLPSKFTMAGNLAKAMASHIADGLVKVDEDTLRGRLDRCSLCEHRDNDRCTVCGCFLVAKASQRSSSCPLAYWPGDVGEGGDQ